MMKAEEGCGHLIRRPLLGLGFHHGEGFMRCCQLVSLTGETGGFSDAGHDTHRSRCSVPFLQCIKPLANACHTTSAMSAVTPGRRSIFSSISWRHPHPSVDSQSGLACCLQPRGRHGGVEQKKKLSDVPAVSGTEPDPSGSVGYCTATQLGVCGSTVSVLSKAHTGVSLPSGMLGLVSAKGEAIALAACSVSPSSLVQAPEQWSPPAQPESRHIPRRQANRRAPAFGN